MLLMGFSRGCNVTLDLISCSCMSKLVGRRSQALRHSQLALYLRLAKTLFAFERKSFELIEEFFCSSVIE
jgi:hypothetical protein